MKQAGAVIALITLLLSTSASQLDIGEDPAEDQIQFSVTFDKRFSLELDPTNPSVLVGFTIDDNSYTVSGTDTTAGSPQQMKYTFDVTSDTNDTGWQITPLPSAINFRSGATGEARIQVVGPIANQKSEYYNFTLNITGQPQQCCGGSKSQTFDFVAHLPGPEILSGRALGGVSTVQARPDEVVKFDLQYTNLGLADKTFNQRVASNNCNLDVTLSGFHLQGQETKLVPVFIQAPADKPYYAFENCLVTIAAESTEGQGSKTIPLTVTVTGTYVDPGWIINLVVFLAIAGAIVWFVLAAKRRAEEEILGKPQPPWTLPAEQVYLTELQKKDPQAAYVVRHFLMEDEYASSLLWYKAYKAATRGRRATERKVLKMEHAFDKWDAKQQRKLDKGDTKADKNVDKLQARLDKKVRKAHKKDLKKWRKQVARLETQAANEHNKAMGEWRKEAKKAKKKGGPEPAQPDRPSVDFPPEPQKEPVALDDHKWVAKKDRILDRSAKKDEKAEARYETARAKRLEAMRKRMERLAQKIDDPEFIEEHPLLSEAQQNAA